MDFRTLFSILETTLQTMKHKLCKITDAQLGLKIIENKWFHTHLIVMPSDASSIRISPKANRENNTKIKKRHSQRYPLATSTTYW